MNKMPKVLLAPNEMVPFGELKYPIYMSPKMDGNRLLVIDGVLYSRTMKVQPNKNLSEHLATLVAISKREGLVFDCELWSNQMSFSELQSIVRSHEKPIPDHVRAYVFDVLTHDEWYNGNEQPYAFRFGELCKWLFVFSLTPSTHIEVVEQTTIYDEVQAEETFTKLIEDGFEGAIVRSIDGRYKHGRARLSEGLIYKYKEVRTEDGRIDSFITRKEMIDNLTRTRDVFGHLERSQKKEDYTEVDALGSTIVRLKNGKTLGVSFAKNYVGPTPEEIWQDRNKYIGRWVEFVYMPHGSKDVPRFGRIIRFRPDLDE